MYQKTIASDAPNYSRPVRFDGPALERRRLDALAVPGSNRLESVPTPLRVLAKFGGGTGPLPPHAPAARSTDSRGGLPDGAEGELNAACKVPGAAIPIDVWEPTLEQRQREQRALTPAPSTGTGVNVQPILPAIFDPSIAPMLRVDLPSVGSGAYSEMTISTAPDAVAVAKGAEKVPSAGVLTPSTSTPKRISGGVAVSLEDEAAVGTESFDAALKNAASMSLSNQLDEEIINGPNSGNRLNGLLAQLTRPTNPSAISTWDSFNRAALAAVDGIWAKDLSELRGLIAATGWALSGRVFRASYPRLRQPRQEPTQLPPVLQPSRSRADFMAAISRWLKFRRATPEQPRSLRAG